MWEKDKPDFNWQVKRRMRRCFLDRNMNQKNLFRQERSQQRGGAQRSTPLGAHRVYRPKSKSLQDFKGWRNLSEQHKHNLGHHVEGGLCTIPSRPSSSVHRVGRSLATPLWFTSPQPPGAAPLRSLIQLSECRTQTVYEHLFPSDISSLPH